MSTTTCEIKTQEKFTGIIFDFNGVLWWDRHLNEAAARSAAQILCKRDLTQEEVDTKLHGVPNKEFFEYLMRKKLTPKELNECIKIKDGIYRELLHRERIAGRLKLSPGAEEFLDFLTKNNFPITIATSSHQKDVDYFFHHLELWRWFDKAKIVYDDGTITGKPSPDPYLRAAAKLGLKPSQCIVIEDALSGFQSAHAAKIGKIIALGPKESHASLLRIPGVSATIENISQIDRSQLAMPAKIAKEALTNRVINSML